MWNILIKKSKTKFRKALLILSGISLLIILFSCGEKKYVEYTVLKNNKADGPIDKALSEKGAKVFKEKCTACHKLEDKYVGPPLGLVTKRRTADFILSQILYPEQMIANNDTVKALIAKYPTPMANQHLNFDDARAVLEYLRQIAENGGKLAN
jgi:mono/diheme cytochrome c family protein